MRAADVFAAFAAFLATLDEGVVPAAGVQRGLAFVPRGCPDNMTEAQFRILLAAEVESYRRRGDAYAGDARRFQADLDRRIAVLDRPRD